MKKKSLFERHSQIQCKLLVSTSGQQIFKSLQCQIISLYIRTAKFQVFTM